MNPFKNHKELKRLMEEYERESGKKAPGFNYDEYNTVEDYKAHLEQLIKGSKT